MRARAYVSPARLELTLLDPQVARKLGIVALNLFDEAFCVLAPEKRLDGVAERVSRARAIVENDVDVRLRIAG